MPTTEQPVTAEPPKDEPTPVTPEPTAESPAKAEETPSEAAPEAPKPAPTPEPPKPAEPATEPAKDEPAPATPEPITVSVDKYRATLLKAEAVPAELYPLLPQDIASLEAYLTTPEYAALKTKLSRPEPPATPPAPEPSPKAPAQRTERQVLESVGRAFLGLS